MRPRRAVVENVLTPTECQELIFVQRALSVAGYRPHVTSLTLHDILHAQPALLLPLVRARHKVWVAVEKHLGCDELQQDSSLADESCGGQQLFVETTSLIAWQTGAALDWHTDDNRVYLAARHVSAVAYLNEGRGMAFSGGQLLFKDDNLELTPAPGLLVCFLATEEHAVGEVLSGERHALTMWFTHALAACEDTKVIRLLPQLATAAVPRGLPDTMYCLADCGQDLRMVVLQSWGQGGSPAAIAPDAAGAAVAAGTRRVQHVCASSTRLSPASQAWVMSGGCTDTTGLNDARLRAAYALWRQHEAECSALTFAAYLQCLAAQLPRLVEDAVSCGMLVPPGDLLDR